MPSIAALECAGIEVEPEVIRLAVETADYAEAARLGYELTYEQEWDNYEAARSNALADRSPEPERPMWRRVDDKGSEQFSRLTGYRAGVYENANGQKVMVFEGTYYEHFFSNHYQTKLPM